MNNRRANWLWLAGAVLLLAGCTVATPANSGAQPLDPPAVTTPNPPLPTATPAAPAGAAASGIPGNLLNAVLDDASQRTGLARDTLVVTRAEAVTWNDGSLGCPEPGMFYTQALVEGYQIVIDTNAQSLDYRAGDNQYFRLCDN
jgi:hypothetical protein